MDYNCLKYKTSIPADYFCKYCSNILTKVIQLDCGCRCCYECANKLLPSKKCDLCNGELVEETCHVDKAFQKEIDNYSIECVKCNWKGVLNNYFEHYTQTHDEFLCKYCKKSFEKFNMLAQHIQENPTGYCKPETNSSNLIEQYLRNKRKNDIHLHLESIYYRVKKLLVNRDAIGNSTLESELNHTVDQNLSQEDLIKEIEMVAKNGKLLEQELAHWKSLLANSKESILNLERRLLLKKEMLFNGEFLWK